MRRIRMKKSRKYEQDKLQAAINASARRALDDLDKSSGMWPTMIGVMVEQCRKIGQDEVLGISLLFSGMSQAINAVGDGVKTGIQNLAEYSNTANTAMSSLMSSMTRLKNSFATAFAPILTTVAPILVKFINLMSDAVTRVGMLIAALTGQKTFTKAIGVQEDYAASLDKTADSAKKATKEVKGYLSPIDELNRYDDGVNSAGTIGGNKYTDPSAGDMFEEVPITSSIKGIADKIRKLIKKEDWEGLGAYIASGINKGLQKIYDVINWNNVGPKITKFCDAFTRTFNSLVDHIDWDLLGRTVGAGITAGIKSSTEENFAGVNDSTVLNWGNSAKEVKTNVRAMKIQANLSLGEMTKGVKSQFQSQYNIMTRKWKNAGDEINRTVGGMSGSIDKSLSSLVGKVESYGSRMESGLSGAISRAADRIGTTLNNIISKVNGMINNINSAISGIERGFTFSYNVQLPNGGRRWGNYSMSLPRVNSVPFPYLASGAVIPPRSEFLAVLGDQKKGNNLEAPESLLRQIVREESGKGQGDGNTYNVTVNASGRKLLDIIISEAEMRRNRNGKNPFELA